MKVIFFDDKGRKIQLFEDTLASEFLYCVSRALAEPEKISAFAFVAEMESLTYTRKFLELKYEVRNIIMSQQGRKLIDYICDIRFPGLSFVQLVDSSQVSPRYLLHYYIAAMLVITHLCLLQIQARIFLVAVHFPNQAMNSAICEKEIFKGEFFADKSNYLQKLTWHYRNYM